MLINNPGKNIRYVDYRVDPARVNAQIKFLNDHVGEMSHEDIASLLASSVAAVAYMMLATNSPKVVKEIFSDIVDQAQRQQDAIKAKQNAPASDTTQ